MSKFRTLNERETATLKTLRARKKISNFTSPKNTVRYDQKGNFTVCLIKCRNSIYTGVAKANPTDSFNAEAGQLLAFTRAVRGY